MTLGDTIKLLRTEQGLTQPELADKARIEQSYLSKLENDKGIPSFDIINRLAQALGLTGMGLIHKLSHSYISENLSHLPEVAAEYATVKEKRERNSKRQLVMASTLLLAGTALYMTGFKQLVASDTSWVYVSDGVIKPGEHYKQFDESPIREISESIQEWQQRLRDNRARIERVYQHSQSDLSHHFLLDVAGGKRFFRLENVVRGNDPATNASNPVNKMLEILGILLGQAGVLLAAYSIWKYQRR